MAPTLTFLSPSSSVFNSLVPPPSQDFAMQQMPDVFVIPPEEEHDYNPPFMFFDSTKAAQDNLCTSPDMDHLDVALGFCQQTDNRAPTFRRSFTNESQETIVMPRRGSILKIGDIDLDMMEEDGQTDIRSRRGVRKFDEEIVEVVKVRRNEGMADIGEGRPEKMKKSNTFRARASQALRSIKLNVGKNQRRATVSEPQRTQNDVQASTLPTRSLAVQDATDSTKRNSPSISRRRSLTLSQLFATHKEKENQTSRPTSPSEEPMSPTCPSLSVSGSSPTLRPMSPTESISSYTSQLRTSPSLEDCVVVPSKSPTLTTQSLEPEGLAKPTLSKRKSFRRRLSVLELQKIFTLGGSSPSPSDTIPPQDIEDDLFSPSRSRPKSMDFASILSGSSARTSTTSATSELTSRPSSSSYLSNANPAALEDIDELEMRLDSLHFDSLHFDPDEIMSAL